MSYAGFRCLLFGAWYSGPAAATHEEQLTLGLAAMKAELHRWYQTSGVTTTQIGDVTLGMIGTVNKTVLKLKDMDSFGFLQYSLSAMDKHRHRIGEQVVRRFAECGQALVSIVHIYKSSPARLTVGRRR